MLELERDPKKIGENLKIKIHAKYDNTRQFCRAYLEERDGSTDNEEIRKLQNRFSQILKGSRNIQIEDLPYITKLLDASCEEILSAGKQHVRVSGRMTNYDIAFSDDRKVWDEYMKHEDKLFLNCDEYGKSVIDYALEFKNYKFIKYLLDERFIWFVDLSSRQDQGFTFGAGTSVKRRELGAIDSSVPHEIQYQDDLRVRTIALAIEKADFDILDSLKARELPELTFISMVGDQGLDLLNRRNEGIIEAISRSEGKILEYFSEEFHIVDRFQKDRTILYPFFGEVIDAMIKNQRYDSAELFLRKAIQHNAEALSSITGLLKEGLESQYEYFDEYFREDDARKTLIRYGFQYDSTNRMVSFHYSRGRHDHRGFVTNLVHVDSKIKRSPLSELIAELNQVYDKILAIGKEEG